MNFLQCIYAVGWNLMRTQGPMNFPYIGMQSDFLILGGSMVVRLNTPLLILKPYFVKVRLAKYEDFRRRIEWDRWDLNPDSYHPKVEC